MNSADRSIALVDYALRRRFSFIELLPSEKVLEQFLLKHPPINITKEGVIEIFMHINDKIKSDDKLGRHYRLGHSYFIKEHLDDVAIKRIWKYTIKPVPEEYYFEDIEQINDIETKFPILKEID